MGFIDNLIKRVTNTRPFFHATVRTGEAASASHSRPHDIDAERRLAALSGYVAICADRRAQDVAGVPLRLYRPKQRGRSDGRSVPRGTRAFLRSGVAGRKAAAMARELDDMEEVVDHPILDLLDRPNAYQSGHGWRHLRQLYLSVAGNAYILPVIGQGGATSMHLLMPQWTSVIPDKDEFVAGYSFGRDGTEVSHFDADEVWHGKYLPSPWSPYYGRGAADAVLREQELYQVVNQFFVASFDNMMRPDAIISTENPLTPDHAKALKLQLDSLHRGPKNASRSLLLGGAGRVTVDPINWSPKDMGDVQIQEASIRAILAAFNVPESEIFMNDGNRAVSERGNLQYMRQAVMPQATREANDYTRWIVEDAFGLDGWCIACENVIPDDEDAIVNRLTQATTAGWMTLNEARAAQGLDPLPPEIGDVPRFSGTSISKLDEQAAAPANPFGGFGGMPILGLSYSPPKNDGTPIRVVVPGGDADTPPSEAGAGHQGHVDRGAVGRGGRVPGAEPACPGGDTCGAVGSQTKLIEADARAWVKALPDDDSPYRDDHKETVALYRGVSEAIVSRRDAILAAMDAKPHGLKSTGVRKDALSDLLARVLKAWGITTGSEAFAADASERTADAIEALLRAGGRAAAAQLVEAGAEIDGDMDTLPILDNPEAVRYFDGFRSQYVRDLAESDATQAGRLERTLREGFEEGETLRELKDRVKATMDETTESRAALIARTESAEAQTQGRLAGYAGSGAVKGYGFLLAPNACPVCEAVAAKYEGKTVALGEPLFRKGESIQTSDGEFKFDYKDTVTPVHPACRCSVGAVLA